MMVFTKYDDVEKKRIAHSPGCLSKQSSLIKFIKLQIPRTGDPNTAIANSRVKISNITKIGYGLNTAIGKSSEKRGISEFYTLNF